MRKTLFFLIVILSTQYAIGQVGYGYVRDKNPTQVNYAEIAKNATDRIKRAVNARERAARDLGWSSAAEMDAARRKHMTKLRNERKMRALQYRINKKKKKAELRRIKKENRLKRKKPKS